MSTSSLVSSVYEESPSTSTGSIPASSSALRDGPQGEDQLRVVEALAPLGLADADDRGGVGDGHRVTTRASRATAPVGPTTSGLTSSSTRRVGEVDGQALDPQDHVDQGPKVGLRLAPYAGEEREALDLADHPGGFGPVERRHPERHVAQHLDQDPAEPEHHDRPEQRVLRHPDDALDPRGRGRAHQHAVGHDRRPIEQLGEGPAHLGGRRHAGDDQAVLALVGQVGGAGLHHDRIPGPTGRPDRVRRGMAEPVVGHGHAVGRQHRLRLELREHDPVLGMALARG